MRNVEKVQIKEYIERNRLNYEKIFYNCGLNKFIFFSLKILESKLLNINYFCYFLNHSLNSVLRNFSAYISLSKQERKLFALYHKTIIKIYMHLDCIFVEIDSMKNIIKRRK